MGAVARQRGALASRLLDSLASQDWMGQAACTPDQAEQWWPVTRDGQETAAAYCRAQCPVVEQCRDYADSTGETDGVWGGETEDQRRNRLAGRPGRGDRLHRCEQCSKVYSARRPEQRYCGHHCHHLAMATANGIRGAGPGCGSPNGARRHRKRGEPVDLLCRYAESLYKAQNRARNSDHAQPHRKHEKMSHQEAPA